MALSPPRTWRKEPEQVVQARDNSLVLAAAHNRPQEVKRLIASAANVNGTYLGHTALCKAAAAGFDVVVEHLLNARADTELTNNLGDTALICAATSGHVRAVTLLIEARCNVNAQGAEQDSAMIRAASNGHLGILDLLSTADADASIKNAVGCTALDMATVENHLEAIELLKTVSRKPQELLRRHLHRLG